jgi:hypothetical protein
MVVWSGQQKPPDHEEQVSAINRLVRAGIPVFSQPGPLVRALQRLKAYWRYREVYLNAFHEEVQG